MTTLTTTERGRFMRQMKGTMRAWEELEPRPRTLADLLEVAPGTAWKLLEAMDALGSTVDPGLLERARDAAIAEGVRETAEAHRRWMEEHGDERVCHD